MTAAARVAAAPRPDPVEVFKLRAWARAQLFDAGEIDLLDAVDALQAAAEAYGLVAKLGQDHVQRLMAEAFNAVHAVDECAAAAASTLQAAEFLMQQRDPARLQRWLDRHGARERHDILQHLNKRRRRHAS